MSIAEQVTKEWYYLFQNPLTDDITVRSEVFLWDGGEWLPPAHQPTFPNMVPGTEFWESHDEAMAEKRRVEDGGRAEDEDRG